MTRSTQTNTAQGANAMTALQHRIISIAPAVLLFCMFAIASKGDAFKRLHHDLHNAGHIAAFVKEDK